MATVAIVGGGFSGTLTALNILRFACRDAPRVVLYERRAEAGPGLAYSTRSAEHQLNVPAGNMSAWEEDPDHFFNWLQIRMPGVKSGSFVPRMLYGEYLKDQLALARRKAGDRLEVRRCGVTAVEGSGGAGAARVRDDGGGVVEAERVVLAVGNFSPAPAPGLGSSMTGHGRYVPDAWAWDLERVGREDDVLFVGTGLTMMDMVSSLHAREHAGRMYALSRHGLLSRAHRSPARAPARREAPGALKTWDGTLRALVRIVREEVGVQAVKGCDWREVITSLRPTSHHLWQRMAPDQQARFVERIRSYWDVLRHRAPPETAAAMQDLIAAKRLIVRAGRVRSIEAAGTDGVAVTFTPSRSNNPMTLRVGWVVNCLGPSSDLRRIEDPLVKQLAAEGLVRPDRLRLGFDMDEQGRCIGRDGRVSERLWAVGPMRRARNWEDTAVPELRRQTSHAARAIVRELCSDAAAAWPAERGGAG